MSSLRNWFAGAVAVLVLAVPSFASAQGATIAELQALIAQLLAQVAALQEQTLPSNGGETSAPALAWNTVSPMEVQFTYTMNQERSCNGGTYYLYFGDEDRAAGEEPQILNFPADACNAYVQHSEHTYEKDGTYIAKLYNANSNVLLGEARVIVARSGKVPSCTIKARPTDVDSGEKFTVTWRTKNIASPVMFEDIKAGGEVSIRKNGAKTYRETSSSTYTAKFSIGTHDAPNDAYCETFVVINGDANEGQQEALDALEEVRDNLNDALDELADIDEAPEIAEELLDDAADLIDDAQDAYDDEDYESVFDDVESAQALIDDARAVMNGNEETLELIDVEVEVNDSNEGPAPLTVIVTGQVQAEEDSSCPIEFPDTTLDWGDGTTGSVTAQAVSTASGGSGCRQTLTQSYTHTYTAAGSYLVSYIVEGYRRDTVRINVTGTVIPREPVASCTVTADHARVTAGQSVVLSWSGKNTSYMRGPNGEQLAASGSKSYQVTETKTFSFTAYGVSGDKASCSTTVSVDTPPATPTLSFTGPRFVLPGEPAALSWSTTNAQRCVLSDNFGMERKVETNSVDYDVYPFQTTTYRLWCANDPGTGKDGPAVEKSVTVRVYERTDRGQLPAAALTSIAGQLDEILKGFKELFGN